MIKIEKHKPGEDFLFEMGETGSKIQDIYESYRNTTECNKTLMKNNLEIDWLLEKLEFKDYGKLEDYILYYSSRNDELLFKLGFQYAWSLFTECAEKNWEQAFKQLEDDIVFERLWNGKQKKEILYGNFVIFEYNKKYIVQMDCYRDSHK